MIFYTTNDITVHMAKRKTTDKVPAGTNDASDSGIAPIMQDGTNLALDPGEGSN